MSNPLSLCYCVKLHQKIVHSTMEEENKRVNSVYSSYSTYPVLMSLTKHLEKTFLSYEIYNFTRSSVFFFCFEPFATEINVQ